MDSFESRMNPRFLAESEKRMLWEPRVIESGRGPVEGFMEDEKGKRRASVLSSFSLSWFSVIHVFMLSVHALSSLVSSCVCVCVCVCVWCVCVCVCVCVCIIAQADVVAKPTVVVNTAPWRDLKQGPTTGTYNRDLKQGPTTGTYNRDFKMGPRTGTSNNTRRPTRWPIHQASLLAQTTRTLLSGCCRVVGDEKLLLQ